MLRFYFRAYWRHSEPDYENRVFLISHPLRKGMKRHCFSWASASSKVSNEQDLHTSHVHFLTKLFSAAHSVSWASASSKCQMNRTCIQHTSIFQPFSYDAHLTLTCFDSSHGYVLCYSHLLPLVWSTESSLWDLILCRWICAALVLTIHSMLQPHKEVTIQLQLDYVLQHDSKSAGSQ